MANKTTSKQMGTALMVIGIELTYWGYEMSGTFVSQIDQAFLDCCRNAV